MAMRCFCPPLTHQGLNEPVRRRWKMTMGKISTFKLPSSAAPEMSSATSCAMSCAMSCDAPFTCPSFMCRPRADLAPPTQKRAEDLIFFRYL